MTVKVLNLKFDKVEARKRIGSGENKTQGEWKIAEDVVSGNPQFICSVEENNQKLITIDCTRDFIEEYKASNGDIKNRDMYLIPLYRKRLIQIARRKDDSVKEKETLLIHVVAEKGKQISSIKLEGAALSERIAYNEERTKAACTVVQLNSSKEYSVKIFQNDGSLISIENGKVINKKVKHNIVMPKIMKAPQILVIPKQTIITNDPATVRKEGCISVLAGAVLSSISIIKENTDAVEYYIAQDVTEEQVAAIAAKLVKPLKRV